MLLQCQKPAFSNAAQPIFAKLGNISVLVLLALLVVRHFRDLLGVLGSGAIAASAVFFAGLYAAGYLLGGSRVAIKGVLGLGTAARNVGAALVPASQSFSDPKDHDHARGLYYRDADRARPCRELAAAESNAIPDRSVSTQLASSESR